MNGACRIDPSMSSLGLDSDDIESTKSFEIERSDLKQYLTTDGDQSLLDKWNQFSYVKPLNVDPPIPLKQKWLPNTNNQQPKQFPQQAFLSSHLINMNSDSKQPLKGKNIQSEQSSKSSHMLEYNRQIQMIQSEFQSFQQKMGAENTAQKNLIHQLREELRLVKDKNDSQQERILELNTCLLESRQSEQSGQKTISHLQQELNASQQESQKRQSAYDSLSIQYNRLKESFELYQQQNLPRKSITNVNMSGSNSTITINNLISQISNTQGTGSTLSSTATTTSNSQLNSNLQRFQVPVEKQGLMNILGNSKLDMNRVQSQQNTRNSIKRMLERSVDVTNCSQQLLTQDGSSNQSHFDYLNALKNDSIINSKLERSTALLDESIFGSRNSLDRLKKSSVIRNPNHLNAKGYSTNPNLNSKGLLLSSQVFEKSSSYRSETKQGLFEHEFWSSDNASAQTKVSTQSPSTQFRSNITNNANFVSPVKVQNFLDVSNQNNPNFIFSSLKSIENNSMYNHLRDSHKNTTEIFIQNNNHSHFNSLLDERKEQINSQAGQLQSAFQKVQKKSPLRSPCIQSIQSQNQQVQYQEEQQCAADSSLGLGFAVLTNPNIKSEETQRMRLSSNQKENIDVNTMANVLSREMCSPSPRNEFNSYKSNVELFKKAPQSLNQKDHNLGQQQSRQSLNFPTSMAMRNPPFIENNKALTKAKTVSDTSTINEQKTKGSCINYQNLKKSETGNKGHGQTLLYSKDSQQSNQINEVRSLQTLNPYSPQGAGGTVHGKNQTIGKSMFEYNKQSDLQLQKNTSDSMAVPRCSETQSSKNIAKSIMHIPQNIAKRKMCFIQKTKNQDSQDADQEKQPHMAQIQDNSNLNCFENLSPFSPSLRTREIERK